MQKLTLTEAAYLHTNGAQIPPSPAENMSLSTLLLLLLLNTDLMKKREGERDIFKEKHAGFKAHGRESSVQKAD